MPIIEVKRQSVRPAVRKVPTSTTAVPMPMTADRIGKELRSDNEEPVTVESLEDAFGKFKPGLSFQSKPNEDGITFEADLRFESVKDFEPANLMARREVKAEDGSVTYLRNDLADLKNNIDLLYRLKDRWRLPAVRRAWSNPEERKQIIHALGELRAELEKVSGEETK
jgi:type VI secretion system protein ImpB